MMLKLGYDALHDASVLDQKSSEIFGHMDADNNGKIEPHELKQAMAEAGIILKNKEVTAMIHEADADGCACGVPLAPAHPHPPHAPPPPHAWPSIARLLPLRDGLIDLPEFQELMRAEVKRYKQATSVCTVM